MNLNPIPSFFQPIYTTQQKEESWEEQRSKLESIYNEAVLGDTKSPITQILARHQLDHSKSLAYLLSKEPSYLDQCFFRINEGRIGTALHYYIFQGDFDKFNTVFLLGADKEIPENYPPLLFAIDYFFLLSPQEFEKKSENLKKIIKLLLSFETEPSFNWEGLKSCSLNPERLKELLDIHDSLNDPDAFQEAREDQETVDDTTLTSNFSNSDSKKELDPISQRTTPIEQFRRSPLFSSPTNLDERLAAIEPVGILEAISKKDLSALKALQPGWEFFSYPKGNNPLHLICKEINSTSYHDCKMVLAPILSFLLKFPVLINAKNEEGDTPLLQLTKDLIASQNYEQFGTLKSALKNLKKADLKIRDSEGFTALERIEAALQNPEVPPLFYRFQNGSKNVKKELLESLRKYLS